MTTAPFEPRPEVAPGEPDETVPAEPSEDPMEREAEKRRGEARRPD